MKEIESVKARPFIEWIYLLKILKVENGVLILK